MVHGHDRPLAGVFREDLLKPLGLGLNLAVGVQRDDPRAQLDARVRDPSW